MQGQVIKSWLELQSRATSTIKSQLTSREQEVLQLIVSGTSTRRIANALCVSSKTVETHRANIIKKLELDSLVDLIKWALKNGYSDR